jgi:hypothetical protein
MSGTTTPVAPAPSEPIWAKPSIGIYSLVLFVAALAISWWTKDSTAFDLMVGAAIANSNTVIQYYFGSSAGSARKTELTAQGPTP